MRLRRQDVYTLAATGRVYEFKTAGGIVLCRFCSLFLSPVWKYWKVGDSSDFSNRFE